MVSIRSFATAGADTDAQLGQLGRQTESADGEAHFVLTFFGCNHDAQKVHAFLQSRFPNAAHFGGTSSNGLMTEGRLWSNEAIGLLIINDGEGQYGDAVMPFDDDPAGAAEAALRRALARASCPGELPALILVYQSPGHEEDVIDGLRRVVDDRCPIIGGSAADNDTSGQWREIGRDGAEADGIAVAVLFPSGSVGTAFQGGFEPAGPNGVVTRVVPDLTAKNPGAVKNRGHEIAEIDGRPAAQVYDEWSNNILGDKAAHGGNVFDETAAHPFGAETGSIDGVPQYLLVHPVTATPTGGMTTFAAVEDGARIHIMRGNKKRLAERAGHVVAAAMAELPGGEKSLAGGLVIYCSGCRRAVEDKIAGVAGDITDNFHDRPFIGCFTFGEQGYISGRNAHGNLMIAAVAFGS
jgi:hypothetical protein